MNDIMIIDDTTDKEDFIFSAREVLKRAGVDKKNLARTIRRNILDNEILKEGIDYINTIYSSLPTEDTQDIVAKKDEGYLLTKKAMEFTLISLRTEKANQLRKQLVDEMNQRQAKINPRQAIDTGLKLAYALIEADKKRQEKEKENELIILKAKGRQARTEVITKINALARKLGMECNNGNVRAVFARLYRCFAANNKRWYWGGAMQAKNHLEYIGEFGGINDLRILHDILVSFLAEEGFFAEDNYDSQGNKRKE